MISFSFRNDHGIECNSLYDFGIYLAERPAFPRPERVVWFTPVEGRHGDLTEDTEAYQDIEINLSCFMLNTDITNNILDKLNIWLSGEGGILTFSFLFDKYYKVKTVKSYAVKESSGILGEFEVAFICEPFKYIIQDSITITSPATIFNKGTFYSEPELKIYGTGNVSITINSNVFYLNNLTDYVVVDSAMPDCYRDTLPMNNNMIGEFPIFKAGENPISWTGNITKIEINPRWRCL